MRCLKSILVSAMLLSGAYPARAGHERLGLRVPDGFEVTEVADERLANDIFCMTLDPRGRLVVSGRGYLRLLVDDDGDGRADRAIAIADGPKDGAQGLLWEDDTLYATADGGLRRYRIGPDGRAVGPSDLIRALRTGGEHDAHAIRRGPDGWLYVLCGNHAGVDRRAAQLPTSPIHDPIAGCVLRFTPDLRHSEIMADGFRNAYGMDFNTDGELFTFDSDNERCVSLPWYEFTRFYHVIPGGHYGWRSPQRDDFWRLPPYACDVVAPAAYLGRGSPTGVVCYRHAQFPEHYRGGMFLCDWTFGRIYFVPLRRRGASFIGRPEVFLEAVGDNGFAPTAIALHPTTGDLFVSIGGRGTRGAVYRIRYPRGLRTFRPEELAAFQPKRRSLDWQSGAQADWLRRASGADALDRLRALLAIQRHREHFLPDQVQTAVRASWDDQDRLVRQVAVGLLASLDDAMVKALGKQARTPLEQTTYGLGSLTIDLADAVRRADGVLVSRDAPPEARLAAVRLLQQALGGITSAQARGTVWEGYTRRRVNLDRRHVSAALRSAFPSGQADLDREVSRTLAMIDDDSADTLRKVADRLTSASDPVEDTHYLIVLARLKAMPSAATTERVAGALLALDLKLTQRHLNRDTNWPLRIRELVAELGRKHPGLNDALLAHPEFGRPDHVLLTRSPGFDRPRAARVFLDRARKDPDFAWNAALVDLIGTLPQNECLPVLRRLWDRGGLEESILPVLARHPEPIDRTKFYAGLHSPQLATVRLCLNALRRLPPPTDAGEVLALVKALRALPDGRATDKLHGDLADYLGQVTGQRTLGSNRQAWTDWFTRTYPQRAAALGGADGVDVIGWHRRLAALDWSAGSAERGCSLFTKASCAACHSGAQALGPDLHGVTGRFSRSDLFTAILQPSKDISPRYRTTLVETADGKFYQGLVIYEAVDSLILQTGPATTVRLTNTQIATRRLTDKSLMPAGLLDKLSNHEIADLYAYLRSLRKPG